MKVDDSGAPWPYTFFEAVPPDKVDGPRWRCPGGICECHPTVEDAERIEHRVFFFDHKARRMPNARCRIIENGRLLNLETPFADDAGTVLLRLRPDTRELLVEWAPAHLPVNVRLPYRRRYHVDLGGDTDQAVHRRLHNLGYSAYATLAEDVVAFQRAYFQPTTGEASHVDVQLRLFHDEGALPPHGAASEDLETHGLSDARTPSATVVTSPGQPGPSGSVSAVATTTLRIELHRAFALFDEDFEAADEVEWPDLSEGNTISEPHQRHRYDPSGLLRMLYPTDSKRTWRLGGGVAGQDPVAEAKLTVSVLGRSDVELATDDRGVAVITLPSSASRQLVSVDVAPPDGQVNTTGKPAGPMLTDENSKADFLYRPFTIHLEVDATGAFVSDSVVLIPGTRPRFVKLIDSTADAPSGNRIQIDWRPDWMLSGKKKRASRRLEDPQDTPLNPFDLSLDEEERRFRAPPAVVIHQTGTHNLPFLRGFLSDSQVTGSHYLVDFDGFVIKLVDEYFKTNHAGGSLWRQRASVNQFSVGIETMHTDTLPFAPTTSSFEVRPRRFLKEQYTAIIRLCRELQEVYPVETRDVVGHMEEKVASAAEKAPGKPGLVLNGTLSRERVGCPGDYFEWQRLEEGDVALERRFFPMTPPDFGPLANLHPFLLEMLMTTSTPARGTKSEAIRVFKQLLFDIGYSVTRTPTSRERLDDRFDTAMLEAIRAFQTRHFSGHRRRYRLFKPFGAERNFPEAGTLDTETMRAIVEVWWAVHQ